MSSESVTADYLQQLTKVGGLYILRIFSKKFLFINHTLIVNVNEELTNLDFGVVEQ